MLTSSAFYFAANSLASCANRLRNALTAQLIESFTLAKINRAVVNVKENDARANYSGMNSKQLLLFEIEF